ncbi:hypothetical protein ACFL2M_00205, partial [Patescibacteria group bacterium]
MKMLRNTGEVMTCNPYTITIVLAVTLGGCYQGKDDTTVIPTGGDDTADTDPVDDGECKFTVSPNSLDFGDVEVGSTDAESFDVSYSCDDGVDGEDYVFTLALDGSGSFTMLPSDTFAISPDMTSSVVSTFEPTEAGVASAILNLTGSATTSKESVLTTVSLT